MRILVVEDEAGIADFLERGLRAEGYDVRLARDGEEGARLAVERDLDLLVLDLLLPGIDGLTVLARVREAHRGLPVIILTARSEASRPVEVLEAGPTEWMTKPFAFDALLGRIEALAGSRSRARHPGESA